MRGVPEPDRGVPVVGPKGALYPCYDLTGVVAVRVPRVALVFERNLAMLSAVWKTTSVEPSSVEPSSSLEHPHADGDAGRPDHCAEAEVVRLARARTAWLRGGEARGEQGGLPVEKGLNGEA